VEAPAEAYAQGGWMELKRGLRQLRDAGIHVNLDMHAMPGVAASKQMFAGNVTSDVQFYKDHNYQRALMWSAVLTAMSHLDRDFSSVVAIECINEPLRDVSVFFIKIAFFLSSLILG
jgi:aryl-phospho-beta-D-glucosidase BglC (GH1 family)